MSEPMEEPPDWSCGGYVYEDAHPFKFGSIVKDGVHYPYLKDPGPAPVITEDTVIATIRWLRPEECPVHGDKDV